MSWDYWGNPPPRRPADGIKAEGTGGKSWWAGRWIAALKTIMDAARLSRGRSYARSGQVTKLDVGPDGVTAKVQGSAPRPYTVTIAVQRLSDAAWAQVVDGMAAEALFAAQLLAGEMPAQIESVFRAAGTSLFPTTAGDLTTDCSCPDWANPCKHVAAVYYILGERFDTDPWLMFTLRGRSKDDVAAALRARRTVASPPVDAREPAPAVTEDTPPPPLAAALDQFWAIPADASLPVVRFDAPDLVAQPVKERGMPPFAAGEATFLAQMEALYRAATAHVATLMFEKDPA